jgi:hypothetical protein
MMFSNPQKGLAEFHRVLKIGGRAAISVTANSERSFYAPIRTALARYIAQSPNAPAYQYTLGDELYLGDLFRRVGFRNIETTLEFRQFPFVSSDAFFGPIEHGVGHMGQEFITLPVAGAPFCSRGC